jgi:hypothetical protein
MEIGLGRREQLAGHSCIEFDSENEYDELKSGENKRTCYGRLNDALIRM